MTVSSRPAVPRTRRAVASGQGAGRGTIRLCAMLAAILIAGAPAAAVSANHPSQMLARMEGEKLYLSSPFGKMLIHTFFEPRSSDAAPCLSSTDIRIGIDMICEYRRSAGTEPELFLGIVGEGKGAARITSVLWRHVLPESSWRCRRAARKSWYACFPKAADRRADAISLRAWEDMLQSGGRLTSPYAEEQLKNLLEDAVRHVP